jgi:hypothetical protein
MVAIVDGDADIGFTMPPSSVSFLEIEAPSDKRHETQQSDTPRKP